MELYLLHLGLLVTHGLVIFVIPIPHVFLELSPEILELGDLVLVGLPLRGLKLGSQHLGCGGRIVSFQGIDHGLVHGCLGNKALLSLSQLRLHLIVLLLKECLLLLEFCLLQAQLHGPV